MSSRRIDSPILNPPFDAPTRHFRFEAGGIPDDVVDGRRPSQYFTPIPAAKKKAGTQQEMSFTEQSVDRIEETKFVNDLRERIDRWRRMGHPDITGTTRRLLGESVSVDQPYVDNKKVRVAGRFTVESLSPCRMLAESANHTALAAEPEVEQFETMILGNLRKAGVQNTFKRRTPGLRPARTVRRKWLHATGGYTDADGASRTVAVSIGPEHGTVTPVQIREAAIEAAKAIPPYDVTIVIGLAFDPQAWQTSKEINADVAECKVGRQRVLLTRATTTSPWATSC